MLILIKKDEHTNVPREVSDLAEAREIAARGLEVAVVGEDGVQVPLAEFVEAQPEAEEAVAPMKPAAKSKKKK